MRYKWEIFRRFTNLRMLSLRSQIKQKKNRRKYKYIKPFGIQLNEREYKEEKHTHKFRWIKLKVKRVQNVGRMLTILTKGIDHSLNDPSYIATHKHNNDNENDVDGGGKNYSNNLCKWYTEA